MNATPAATEVPFNRHEHGFSSDFWTTASNRPDGEFFITAGAAKLLYELILEDRREMAPFGIDVHWAVEARQNKRGKLLSFRLIKTFGLTEDAHEAYSLHANGWVGDTKVHDYALLTFTKGSWDAVKRIVSHPFPGRSTGTLSKAKTGDFLIFEQNREVSASGVASRALRLKVVPE